MSRNRQFMAWACALPLIGAMIFGAPAKASTPGSSEPQPSRFQSSRSQPANPKPAMPSLAWDGAKRLGVQCLVDPDTLPDRRGLQARLCDRLQALAALEAPIPVVELAAGDPGLIAADTAVLLFHGHAQAQGAQAPLLVFSLRVFRATAAPSELFGAAPRAVALPSNGSSAAFDAALNAALSETLPWRTRPAP